MSREHSFSWGLALSVVALILSFCAGIYMGLFEDAIRASWTAAAQSVIGTLYNNDPASVDAMLEEAWTCLIRAHLHWGALGAATLVMSSIILKYNIPDWYKQGASICMGLGAVIYPTAWLYIANKLAVMGPAAQETIKPLAAVGIGLLMAGTLSFLLALFIQRSKEKTPMG